MSYIENLTGNTIEGGLQETLSLGVGNFKIRGFDLTNTGDYLVLSSGIALIDGLRVISTGNLQVETSTALNKNIFLRIQIYTQIENGISVRKANLSLIAQTSSTPENNDDLYANIVGTKDVLLGIVDGSGVVDINIENVLLPYDTGWVAPTMETGYTYTGNGVRRIGNVVYFGIYRFSKLDGTAMNPNIAIATLLIQFRPSVDSYINCSMTGVGTGYFQIGVDGEIRPFGVGSVNKFNVPPISYLI